MFPTRPKLAPQLVVGFFFFSNPILSRYYNLIHLSPLACILLLQEFFLWALLCLVAVEIRGACWCLTDDPK
jgi:hypothetical protein